MNKIIILTLLLVQLLAFNPYQSQRYFLRRGTRNVISFACGDFGQSPLESTLSLEGLSFTFSSLPSWAVASNYILTANPPLYEDEPRNIEVSYSHSSGKTGRARTYSAALFYPTTSVSQTIVYIPGFAYGISSATIVQSIVSTIVLPYPTAVISFNLGNCDDFNRIYQNASLQVASAKLTEESIEHDISAAQAAVDSINAQIALTNSKLAAPSNLPSSSQVYSQIGNLNGTINNLQGDINGQNKALGDLNNQLSQLQSQRDSQNGQKNALLGQQNQNYNALNNANSTLNSAIANAQNLLSAYNNLQANYASLNNQINNLAQPIQDNDVRVQAARRELAAALAEQTTLNNNLANLKNAAADTANKLASAKNNVDNANNAVDTARTAFNNYQAQVNDVNSQGPQVDAAISKTNAAISGVQNQISGIQNQLANSNSALANSQAQLATLSQTLQQALSYEKYIQGLRTQLAGQQNTLGVALNVLNNLKSRWASAKANLEQALDFLRQAAERLERCRTQVVTFKLSISVGSGHPLDSDDQTCTGSGSMIRGTGSVLSYGNNIAFIDGTPVVLGGCTNLEVKNRVISSDAEASYEGYERHGKIFARRFSC